MAPRIGRPFSADAMLELGKRLRPASRFTASEVLSEKCGDKTDVPREIAEAALAHVVDEGRFHYLSRALEVDG